MYSIKYRIAREVAKQKKYKIVYRINSAIFQTNFKNLPRRTFFWNYRGEASVLSLALNFAHLLLWENEKLINMIQCALWKIKNINSLLQEVIRKQYVNLIQLFLVMSKKILKRFQMIDLLTVFIFVYKNLSQFIDNYCRK